MFFLYRHVGRCHALLHHQPPHAALATQTPHQCSSMFTSIKPGHAAASHLIRRLTASSVTGAPSMPRNLARAALTRSGSVMDMDHWSPRGTPVGVLGPLRGPSGGHFSSITSAIAWPVSLCRVRKCSAMAACLHPTRCTSLPQCRMLCGLSAAVCLVMHGHVHAGLSGAVNDRLLPWLSQTLLLFIAWQLCRPCQSQQMTWHLVLFQPVLVLPGQARRQHAKQLKQSCSGQHTRSIMQTHSVRSHTGGCDVSSGQHVSVLLPHPRPAAAQPSCCCPWLQHVWDNTCASHCLASLAPCQRAALAITGHHTPVKQLAKSFQPAPASCRGCQCLWLFCLRGLATSCRLGSSSLKSTLAHTILPQEAIYSKHQLYS